MPAGAVLFKYLTYGETEQDCEHYEQNKQPEKQDKRA